MSEGKEVLDLEENQECSSCTGSLDSSISDYELIQFPSDFTSTDFNRSSGVSLRDSPVTPSVRLVEGSYHSFRSCPLGSDEFNSLFDKEGRITDEHLLRQKIFQGGVHPSIRQEVWCFLFGFFPCHSTAKEREALRIQKTCQYYALKKKWQSIIMNQCPTFDLTSPDNFLVDGQPVHTDKSQDSYATLAKCSKFQRDDVYGIEAEIFASRTPCPLKLLYESLRFISKDVPRTDRSYPYFAGDSPNLLRLRDALLTASILLAEVGYVQGMNDIMGRFLAVFDSEPMAFWCFHYYIQTVQRDFLSDGMLQRIKMLQDLLKELDSDLYNYLRICEVSELIFSHKWLLLGFQREFSFEEGLCILEILCSHHLELYAPQGLHAREESKRILQGKGFNFAVDVSPSDFSFDLFVAAAILTLFRNRIFLCSDGSQIFQFISSLSGKLHLDDVLCQAEKLFYAYCHKSVTDAFLLI